MITILRGKFEVKCETAKDAYEVIRLWGEPGGGTEPAVAVAPTHRTAPTPAPKPAPPPAKPERRKYTKAFKARMVAKAMRKGVHIPSLSKEMGINEQVLYNWIRLSKGSIKTAKTQNGEYKTKQPPVPVSANMLIPARFLPVIQAIMAKGTEGMTHTEMVNRDLIDKETIPAVAAWIKRLEKIVEKSLLTIVEDGGERYWVLKPAFGKYLDMTLQYGASDQSNAPVGEPNFNL